MGSYENVDVYLKDQQQNPISGVIVRVTSPDGRTFFTQQTTDGNGQASFLLYTQDYAMRFYKQQVSFTQPQQFTVLPSPATNEFNVSAVVFIPPISSDDRLCRCSGFFRDPDGSPQTFLDLQFYPQFTALLLDSAAVTPSTSSIRTDKMGYAEIDLIRGAQYRVTIQGLDSEERFIRVPDLPSANLPDVLFPVIARVTFDPPGPYSLGVGDSLTLTPVIYDSAGAILTGTGDSDANWTTDDPQVANVSVEPTTLTLRGVTLGTTNLVLSRRDLSIVSIPAVAIEGQPVPVTVS